MLRPQRGQFRNGATRRFAAGSSVLVINTTVATATAREGEHITDIPAADEGFVTQIVWAS
jgi:hypothetical protein